MSSSTPDAKVTPIDFSQTTLAQPYCLFYAKVIDDLLTPEECADLLALAQPSDGDAEPWNPAGLTAGSDGQQTVHSNFRNSDRVLVFNTEAAQLIYDKLRPYVEEIHDIRPDGRWATITGKIGSKHAPTWTLVGVNSRLSFLRYRPSQYFKPHCDGLNEIGSQKSFVTLHLYLNDSTAADDPISSTTTAPGTSKFSSTPMPSSVTLPLGGDEALGRDNATPDVEARGDEEEPLEGGATRFWTPDRKAYMDVFPKVGRALLFQQRMLLHSGEPVTRGTKYTMRSDLMFEKK